MRSWMCVSFVLMIVGSSGLFSKDQNGSRPAKSKQAENKKVRVFCMTSEFELEQKNGSDVVSDGKTIPGRYIVRFKGTLELLENQKFVWPHQTAEYSEADGHRHSEDSWFEIKVKSVGQNRIRLEVAAKQSTAELLQAGESRSWNLSLEGSKTAKLGEKVKLEFGNAKTLGTKCTFEGVIEEKDQEKK